MDRTKRLAVLDFDYTVIDRNSDTIIYRVFEDGKLPEKLKELGKTLEWNDFMKAIF